MIEKIEDVLYADGWEDCLVGHGSIFHGSDGPKTVAIYDRNKMVARMVKEMMSDHIEVGSRTEEMDEENFWSEADEYISFNVEGAFIQPGMPVFATFDEQVDFTKVATCECGKC
jgi:hypothetical protein